MPTSPIDHIPRFCSELKLSGEIKAKAVETLKQAADKELTYGRGPTGVAVAALYISSTCVASAARRARSPMWPASLE